MGSPSRRRIGIVSTWFERGAAYVSRQFLEALQEEHAVFIYGRGGEVSGQGDPRWDGPQVTWDRGSSLLYPTALDREGFVSWLRTNGIDLVFFNEQRWWPPVQWCDELGLVTGCYLDYYTRDTIPMFGLYDFLVANTRRHYSVFEWHPNCRYVPWGTNVDLVRPKTLELADPPLVTFFHSAGMDPVRKGTDLVLRAFTGFCGKARLLVHSQVNLRRALPSLRSLIRRLEAEGCLELITATIPLPGLYHRGDVYLYPSRLEGIGLSIAEALAAGLPTVITDAPPMNEFADPDSSWLIPVTSVSERSDGYFWPQCEPDLSALRDTIGRCIQASAVLPERKRAARRLAETSRDWRRNSRCLPEIFAAARPLDGPEKRLARELASQFQHRPIRRRHRWFQFCPGLYARLRDLRRKFLAG